MNNQASAASILLLINVLAPAVIALPFIPIPAIMHHVLSATVVVLVVKLVVVIGHVELEESGCHV